MGSKPWAGRRNAWNNQGKRKAAWQYDPEHPKSNEALPDTIGIGAFERRTDAGELQIFFAGSHVVAHSPHVTLGMFATPKDGAMFYVNQRLKGEGIFDPPVVAKFDSLLPAITFIIELRADFDRKQKDQTNENVPD